jgi:hypothetical protein
VRSNQVRSKMCVITKYVEIIKSGNLIQSRNLKPYLYDADIGKDDVGLFYTSIANAITTIDNEMINLIKLHYL